MVKKPDYVGHRVNRTAIDPTNLVTLLAQQGGRGMNLTGYTSIQGFVTFTGGTAPTVSIQPLELVRWTDIAGVQQSKLAERGSVVGPLSGDDSFEVLTPGGGIWVLRITALTGAPTNVSIYCAAGNRAPEGSI